MALTRESVLDADDLPREQVSCPEWGGDLWVHTLDSVERGRLDKELWGKDVDDNHRTALMVIACTFDEHGNRFFEDGDVERLRRKNAKSVGRLGRTAQRLNYLTAAELAEIEKN